jgi:hypothetical protein
MGKPTCKTCFLIPIFRNGHEMSKQCYYNERSRKLEIMNIETAEKASSCKWNNKFFLARVSTSADIINWHVLFQKCSCLFFFQPFVIRIYPWDEPTANNSSGVFVILWTILEKTLNYTQVFRFFLFVYKWWRYFTLLNPGNLVCGLC